MSRKRESKRIGYALLLALATAAGLPLAAAWTSQSPETFGWLLVLSPLTFVVALLFWALILVGPYRPPVYTANAPNTAPPAPPLPTSGRPTVSSRRSSRPQ